MSIYSYHLLSLEKIKACDFMQELSKVLVGFLFELFAARRLADPLQALIDVCGLMRYVRINVESQLATDLYESCTAFQCSRL